MEKLNRGLTNAHSKRQWLNELALPFFETAIGTSFDLAQQTGDPTYYYKALELAESSQSMLMTDAQIEQRAAQRGGIPEQHFKRYQQLQYQLRQAQKERSNTYTIQQPQRLAELDERIFDCQHQMDRLLHQFEQDYPAYRKVKYQLHWRDARQLQAALPSKTGLLEFFEGRHTIYAFYLTRDTLFVHHLDHTAAYDRQLNNFVQQLSNMAPYYEDPIAAYDAFTASAQALYQQLIAPVVPVLPKRLLLVPDGTLSYLPFEVLLTRPVPAVGKGQAVDGNFSVLPYVLRQSTVHYLFSGSLWLEQQQSVQPPINEKILGFAPNYSLNASPPWRSNRETQLRKRLYPLVGAAREVEHLQQCYRGRYLTGDLATEAAFKAAASQYGILHLALHGLVDPTDSYYSSLALAENTDSIEDNFLYLYEIQQLPLKANLVVLSACETGIGQYQRGEGVISLGRGFVYAGVPALVTTLWSLNDASGAVLMEQFYKALSEGACKDEALRQAKLYYLDEYKQYVAHPYLWAAFITVGDYNPIVVEPISDKKYYLAVSVVLLLMVGGLFGRHFLTKN